jgi:BirA family biotin operon repressor/biotin-[acetyl-CoA-carboxylase] ligase
MEAWPARIEAVCAASRLFQNARVLNETASTQDVARGMGVGAVVTAWRQTGGRGRLGRAWADTREDGVAISVVVRRPSSALASIAAGVAAAVAIERTASAAGHASLRIMLKWPNDLMLGGKKLGGILVEGDEAVLVIGIGINCSQREFSAELASRATSLRLHGTDVDRIDLACELLRALDAWLVADDAEVVAEFERRDALAGGRHEFATPDGKVAGVVLGVDPLHGIRVEADGGILTLDPHTTSVVPQA